MLKKYNKTVLNGGYKLVRECKFPNKIYRKLAKEYDDMGYIDETVGRELNFLFDDNYSVGIHRTGYSKVDSNYLHDVFYNGLINNGDLMQGVISNDYINISKTVSIYSNFIVACGQIKSAHKYKYSDELLAGRNYKPLGIYTAVL